VKKTLYRKAVFGFGVMLLASFFFFKDSVFAEAEAPDIRVTIKGKISNIPDVGQYITHQTLLQLYPCDTTDKIDLRMNGQVLPESTPEQKEKVYYLDNMGRLVPQSTLPAVGLPVFGDFNFFNVRGLTPGKCYKICVKRLEKPYSGIVPLVHETGKVFEIVLPEPEGDGNNGKIRVDVSEHPLMIPAP
jgi:hypothetical protein